ncbi:hypothetical protein PGB90_010470 [Kerria lacca]
MRRGPLNQVMLKDLTITRLDTIKIRRGHGFIKRDKKASYKYNTVNNVEGCSSGEQMHGNVQSQKKNSKPKIQAKALRCIFG